jgi:hypothetical protein
MDYIYNHPISCMVTPLVIIGMIMMLLSMRKINNSQKNEDEQNIEMDSL